MVKNNRCRLIVSAFVQKFGIFEESVEHLKFELENFIDESNLIKKFQGYPVIVHQMLQNLLISVPLTR